MPVFIVFEYDCDGYDYNEWIVAVARDYGSVESWLQKQGTILELSEEQTRTHRQRNRTKAKILDGEAFGTFLADHCSGRTAPAVNTRAFETLVRQAEQLGYQPVKRFFFQEHEVV